MRITKVVIRRFKRFEHTEFDIPPDGIVFAGPNNTGKTTLLQAVAAWSLAMRHWLELGDYNARNGFVKVPLARQAFYSVPLRNFKLLWHGGKPNKRDPIQIELCFGDALSYTMEIVYDTTEQIYVRPVYKDGRKRSDSIKILATFRSLIFPKMIYVPAMTGITMEEPLYQPAKITQLLGQGRPGEILRNLLVQTHENQKAWDILRKTIHSLFRYEIQPPQTRGANIVAEYLDNGMRLDIASAGSGFLQVLMLLTFLSSNKRSILLLDEPDAHLHILLQDKIFSVLKDFARDSKSTLILATHSERIINTTELKNLSVVLDNKPRPIINNNERIAVITSLTALDNSDIMLAHNAKGILYVEGHTDISLLRAWAKVLDHHLFDFLDFPFWKPTVYQPVGKERGKGIHADKHYDAMCLAAVIPGLELHDSDGRDRPDRKLKNGLRRIFWRRYEIESYLIHPDAVARFAETIGGEGAGKKARAYLNEHLPPAVYTNPLGDNAYYTKIKAKDIIDNTVKAAGIRPFINRYRIAEQMKKDEIHPEVIEKLDTIAEHFGVPKK